MAELCLGTVQFGLDYGIQGNGQPKEEEAAGLLAYAFAHGVKAFDTAAAYGTAEDVLGGYLRAARRSGAFSAGEPRVVTKLPPNALDGVEPDGYAGAMREALRASLERLHLDRADGFLFHNAGYIFQERAVRAMISIKETGLAEHVGVSVYTPEEALKALEYSGMDYIQIPYNVLDRRLDRCGFFEKARAKNVTVFARSALLQGLLCMPLAQIPAKMEFALPYLRAFDRLCQELSLTRFQAAVGYAAAHSGIDYLVFGTDNQKQLAGFIGAAREPVGAGRLKLLSESFRSVEDRVLMPNLW